MGEGSPLLIYSRRQQQALAISYLDVAVELAMSYGQPALPQAIARLLAQDITQLVILPLYPQYSCSTSAAIWDAVAHILTGYRRLPSISFMRDYAAHPAYIAARDASVERAFTRHGRPNRLVISFHAAVCHGVTPRRVITRTGVPLPVKPLPRRWITRQNK